MIHTPVSGSRWLSIHYYFSVVKSYEHRHIYRLFNSLFKPTPNQTSKRLITGPLWVGSLLKDQRMFNLMWAWTCQCGKTYIPWRHHAYLEPQGGVISVRIGLETLDTELRLSSWEALSDGWRPDGRAQDDHATPVGGTAATWPTGHRRTEKPFAPPGYRQRQEQHMEYICL